MNKFSSPLIRWRIVAALLFLGTLGNVIFAIPLIAGKLDPISRHAFILAISCPPAIERVAPTLQALGELGGRSIAAVAYLTISSMLSVALAVGLWNTKKWAAWITTAFMFFAIAANGYGIVINVRMGARLSDLVMYGMIPAFAWAMTYISLLWANWIFDRLVPIASAITRSRRERVTL